MKSRPQTIQIFLPDGNPRGIKIAEITNRTIKAALFPRNQFEYMLQRKELTNVGFYFLFGQSENGKNLAYIGEAEDCADRLKSHHRDKDFWNYAIVIISKTHAFTKTHVKFLEHTALKKAKEANRYNLDNSVEPNLPFLTESMEADMLDCFDTAKVLLSTLGFPLFESIAKEIVVDKLSEAFMLKGKIHAEGDLIDEGFVVFKGSQINAIKGNSLNQSQLNIISRLEKEEILINNIFTTDYIFSSASTAASILLGRSANGWKEWRNEEGKTLDEMKRKIQ